MTSLRWLSYTRSARPDFRSCADQAQAISQYVERDGGNPGEVVEFTDRGFSGLIRFEQRPGGGKLFDFMRRGDRLLVTSFDRLSRDPADLLRILAVLADAGVTLHVLEPRGQVCDIEVGTLQMICDGLEQLGINPNTDD
jgi:DNA invertase Pin-like site-specific DNA recombinase